MPTVKMISWLVVPLLFCTVSSKKIWPNDRPSGPFYDNIKVNKDKPLNLPVHENLTIYYLGSTIYSNSFSQLNVTNFCIEFSRTNQVERGGLCSSPTIRRLKFSSGLHFKLTEDVLVNCENLEELRLEGVTDFSEYCTSIEGDVFENLPKLKNLELLRFEVKNLTRNLFKNLRSLEYLTLYNIGLKEFDTNAFVDLTNLKELDIMIPALKEEPEVIFNSSINVDKLAVRGINSSLSAESLAQLHHVSELTLSFKYLNGIEAGALCSSSSLKRLKLIFDDDNRVIINRDVFKNCGNLEEVAVTGHNNPVEEDAFGSLQNLKTLSLEKLKFNRLTRNYLKLPSLEELHLEVLVQTIDGDAFADLKNLQELEIKDFPPPKNETVPLCPSSSLRRLKLVFEHNNLFKITQTVLKNCENLKKLAITGSYGKIDDNSFENLAKLRTLSLSSLQMSKVTRNYFKNLPLLEELHLHSVNTRRIDEDAFTDLKNLKTLSVSYNGRFRTIPEKLFANTPKLENIFLNGNSLQNLTWDEFKGLSAVKKLNVGDNNLLSVDGGKIAENLPNLRWFDITRNFDLDYEKLEASSLKELRAKLNHSIEILLIWRPDFGF